MPIVEQVPWQLWYRIRGMSDSIVAAILAGDEVSKGAVAHHWGAVGILL